MFDSQMINWEHFFGNCNWMFYTLQTDWVRFFVVFIFVVPEFWYYILGKNYILFDVPEKALKLIEIVMECYGLL